MIARVANPVKGMPPASRSEIAHVVEVPATSWALVGSVCSEKSSLAVTVKGSALVPVPRDVVTVTGPERASSGTAAVTVVGVIERTMAGLPSNATCVPPAAKPVPVMATRVPTGPLVGLSAAMVGLVRTVNVRTAGVGGGSDRRARR